MLCRRRLGKRDFRLLGLLLRAADLGLRLETQGGVGELPAVRRRVAAPSFLHGVQRLLGYDGGSGYGRRRGVVLGRVEQVRV